MLINNLQHGMSNVSASMDNVFNVTLICPFSILEMVPLSIPQMLYSSRWLKPFWLLYCLRLVPNILKSAMFLVIGNSCKVIKMVS